MGKFFTQRYEGWRIVTGQADPGVQPASHIDGKPKRWSWGCPKCGAMFDGQPTRKQARKEYREHREHYCPEKPDPRHVTAPPKFCP